MHWIKHTGITLKMGGVLITRPNLATPEILFWAQRSHWEWNHTNLDLYRPIYTGEYPRWRKQKADIGLS